MHLPLQLVRMSHSQLHNAYDVIPVCLIYHDYHTSPLSGYPTRYHNSSQLISQFTHYLINTMITSHSPAETFISYVQWLLTSTLFLLGLQATRTLYLTVIVFIRNASAMTSTTGNVVAARRTGCKARIQTLDKQLISPVPEHDHDVQHAETEVHKAKQSLKRRAAESDLPTKFLASEVPKGMDQEARAKVGCHPSSLARMARRSRQTSNRHPANPRSLEELTLPPHLITSNSQELSRLFKSRTGFN